MQSRSMLIKDTSSQMTVERFQPTFTMSIKAHISKSTRIESQEWSCPFRVPDSSRLRALLPTPVDSVRSSPRLFRCLTMCSRARLFAGFIMDPSSKVSAWNRDSKCLLTDWINVYFRVVVKEFVISLIVPHRVIYLVLVYRAPCF